MLRSTTALRIMRLRQENSFQTTAHEKTTLQRQIISNDSQIDQLVGRSCVAGKGNQRHAAECFPGLASWVSSGTTGCIARERGRGVHA